MTNAQQELPEPFPASEMYGDWMDWGQEFTRLWNGTYLEWLSPNARVFYDNQGRLILSESGHNIYDLNGDGVVNGEDILFVHESFADEMLATRHLIDEALTKGQGTFSDVAVPVNHGTDIIQHSIESEGFDIWIEGFVFYTLVPGSGPLLSGLRQLFKLIRIDNDTLVETDLTDEIEWRAVAADNSAGSTRYGGTMRIAYLDSPGVGDYTYEIMGRRAGTTSAYAYDRALWVREITR